MPFDRLMGIVPLGVGGAVLMFALGNPNLPGFLRLFFGFIAIGFVLTGLRLLSGKLFDPKRLAHLHEELRSQIAESSPPSKQGHVNYECPNCAATLDASADVSPHGDVKCTYCDRWFNIHQSQST